jgi:hypothetical protein
LSAAKTGVVRKPGLWGLISSRFEYFLAFFVVALSIIVIVVALMASTSQPVIQGMTAIISGVIGFYFGNRGAERAEERVREVENQLVTGVGPLAIQRAMMEEGLQEIDENMKQAIRLAQRASELHEHGRKIEADRYFRDAKESTEESCEAMKAWLAANHAWLKLDQDLPNYKEILDMFNKSIKHRDKTDFPGGGLFRSRTDLGRAIALIWRCVYEEGAQVILNGIKNDIDGMNDLYEAGDLKKRDVKKFLETKNLDEKVVKYLEGAKSYYKRKGMW